MLQFVSTIEFQRTVRQWFAQYGALAVMLEGGYGAPFGNLFTDYETMLRKIEQVQGGDYFDTVCAMHQYNLPVRGIVNDQFIQKVLAFLSGSMEYIFLVAEAPGVYDWVMSDLYEPQGRELILAEIEKQRGHEAVFGQFPWYAVSGNTEHQVVTELPFETEV